ncbi:hypothetical protein SNE26_17245 [Mucilaginibacter sp. cycad4]|uniref:hypothetical protein n=1 Tax=Mucilaginibacter sp. cycad4 TaxID=3342096 RepID=UPI002AABCC7F|nr:hypothetical protein [Mucilaginibacter gossypii]WPU97775.1 hypothetical protein SNE26_17245 [Mucilaginibacter gossypii]
MAQDIPLDSILKKGKMTRKPWLMTPAERADWLAKMQNEAKEYLFSIGQPLVYKKDGRFLAEYADGTTKVLK